MKAYVLHGVDNLRLEEREKPVPGDGEVVVSVRAAGICGSDIPRIYQNGTYSFPMIPGHEFAGTVARTGKNVPESWQNKRVGVFPLLPCGSCGPCLEQKYELCRAYGYLGSRTDGGFAEYVRVPVFNLIELPKNVSFETAAMLEPMAVAVHAGRMSAVKTEDTVVLCGLGTIGLLLLMFLLEAGVRNILAVGNKESQRKLVSQMGLPEDSFCDVREEEAADWILKQTKGRGVDLFFDCVGKNETLVQALNSTAPGGRIQLVGNPSSDMLFKKADYWKLLRNQLTLRGAWNSSFTHDREDDWHYALSRLSEGRIHPELLLSHRLPFSELERGLEIMRWKSEDYGKIIGIR